MPRPLLSVLTSLSRLLDLVDLGEQLSQKSPSFARISKLTNRTLSVLFQRVAYPAELAIASRDPLFVGMELRQCLVTGTDEFECKLAVKFPLSRLDPGS